MYVSFHNSHEHRHEGRAVVAAIVDELERDARYHIISGRVLALH